MKDVIGDRIKSYYENIPKIKLMRRCPVIVRIDGKAFHTFTKGFKKPFDEVLITAMQRTMLYLCENIQGCVLGYHQSDEISLLLVDYQKLESGAFFDYEVQKMCSVIASMATMRFNKAFEYCAGVYCDEYFTIWDGKDKKEGTDYIKAFSKAVDKGAMFDCRVFNIPKEEVANYFYWRQADATRNSIQMVGRSYFSHKQLNNKSCEDIQEMLFQEHKVNWNDYPIYQKRGSCCVKKKYIDEDGIERRIWAADNEIPIFKGEDRNYIDRLVYVGE